MFPQLQGSAAKLKPAKWRLDSVSVQFGPGVQRTLLPALVRANAASLRKVKVAGLAMNPADLKAVFAALAECSALADAELPCCKDVAQLEHCAALTTLNISATHLMLSGAAAADVKAVAKLLARPAVVERVESLALTFFKFGVTKQAAQGMYKAVRGMRKLKSLYVAFCVGFAGELKATLQGLPLLEELRLVDGDEPSWLAKVLADVAPANAPALKTVRLHPNLLGNDERQTHDAARGIEQRFAAAGRPVAVLVEKGEKSPADSSDEEDDDGGAPGGDPGCVVG